MSQSLIIFRPSGKVEYQLNNKISPFNEFIASIVNETHVELESNYYMKSISQKRFYAYKKDDLYAALYFDVVTILDSDKIKQTLSSILKIYIKLSDESENKDDKKLNKLIEMQFNQLSNLKGENVNEVAISEQDNSKISKGVRKGQKKVGNKKMRRWDNGELVDIVDGESLDYSESTRDNSPLPDGNNEQLKIDKSAFTKENDFLIINELEDILDSDDEKSDNDTKNKPTGFFGKISSYFGGSVNIDEVSKKFYDQLVSKNIAPPTAKIIIDRIKEKLESKSSVTMEIYKQTLTQELTKILTPNVSTDLLYEIKRNSSSGRPYVISVVGVNGVGKSTNLAKLAYWFLQNNLSVLICACDTFRSGAVEQLKVHVNNLKKINSSTSTASVIDIFEKGYGGGDHVVTTAKLAIAFAAAEKYDIVLIDTAGRTHSNAKLMAPLKKFGDAANPDKIIMVGEALVGTDSVEQAINFNNAFGNRRNLDFFIISKVDTVGDLVGTMINMVQATKVPILFIGTGQTYTDIKRLSVKRVVDLLMN